MPITKDTDPVTLNLLKKTPLALWMGLLITGQLVFAWYIFALYLQPINTGDNTIWNRVLENMYVPKEALANFSIALHLFGGAVISIIGPFQLFPSIRNKAPHIHRWSGRIYMITAIIISLAGLTFIFSRGSVGGLYMDIGFALYGALMLMCVVQAWLNAMSGNYAVHRQWAIRLFALGMSSWLYRVEYGFWAFINQGLPGHTDTFDGPFDIFMNFAFYIPTLMAVELYFYAQKKLDSKAKLIALTVVMFTLLPVMALGCFAAASGWWMPAVNG